MYEGEEPLILSLDTATEVRSAAIMRGTHLMASREGDVQSGAHSASLLGELDAVLRAAAVELREVELFAVAAGPGSFTGLRAGVATMKAFAATLRRPVRGISTLHAVARAVGASSQTLAALPAGRGELFAQLLRVTPEGEVSELEAAGYLSPGALLGRAAALEGRLLWAGSGAHAHRQVIAERALRESVDFVVESGATTTRGGRVWQLAPPAKALAAEVGALALADLRAGRASEAQDLRAIYVRPSDAEIKEVCRTPNQSPT